MTAAEAVEFAELALARTDAEWDGHAVTIGVLARLVIRFAAPTAPVDALEAKVRELLARQWVGGTIVVNCVPHMDVSLLNRPADCPRCQTDVRNALSRAIAINEWLNAWKDEAIDLFPSLASIARDAQEALRDITARVDAEIVRMEELWEAASRKDDYPRIVQTDAHLNGLKFARRALSVPAVGQEGKG